MTAPAPASDATVPVADACPNCGGWLAALKLPVLFIGIVASHLLYRLLQFLLVLATT
jgi:hypothetical protein